MPITSSASGIKAGTVAMFAASTAPAGWLKANGAAVSRTAYAALFLAIGTTYGAGDGATTFNLPDCRGEFLRCLDDGRGVDAGRAIGSAQAGQNLSHNHGGADGAAGSHSHTVGSGVTVLGNPDSQQGAGAGGGISSSTAPNHQHSIASDGGSEARPRNLAMLACIKF